ncbi:hypothetical protein J5N97_018931 [Dioscorea zingiberensis]|uniref:Uncharacterized protein n=1 Tax=Dioscorea zingiberensis TaxID=325984 RepID=A0A9D5CD26_9LILI|nr:hypothetical protein J5N97_018931 [Dioscorea zingiberensis]
MASMKAMKTQGSNPAAPATSKVQQAKAAVTKAAAKKVEQKPKEPAKVTGSKTAPIEIEGTDYVQKMALVTH